MQAIIPAELIELLNHWADACAQCGLVSKSCPFCEEPAAPKEVPSVSALIVAEIDTAEALDEAVAERLYCLLSRRGPDLPGITRETLTANYPAQQRRNVLLAIAAGSAALGPDWLERFMAIGIADDTEQPLTIRADTQSLNRAMRLLSRLVPAGCLRRGEHRPHDSDYQRLFAS